MIRKHILLLLLTIWFTHNHLPAQSADDSTSNGLYSYLGWDGQLVEQPTIIKGKFIGIDSDSLEMEMSQIVYNHLVDMDQPIYHFEVSDSGTFEVVFPLMRPQEIMINLPFVFGYIYAVPGKTTSFTMDVGKAKSNAAQHQREVWRVPAPLTFNGDVATFNTFFNVILSKMRKTFYWIDNKEIMQSLDQMEYKKARIAVWNVQLDSLTQYIGNNDVPDAVRIFFETKMKYYAYNDLMRYGWLKNYKTDRSHLELSPEYLDFITAENLNNFDGLVTEEYSSWMHDLDMHLYNLIQTDYQKIYEILDIAGILDVDDGTRLMYMEYEKENGNEETLKLIEKEFNDSILLKYRDDLRSYIIQSRYDGKVALLGKDGIYPPGIGRDIIATKFFMYQISQQRMLDGAQLQDVDRLIQNKDLKDYVRMENDALRNLDDVAMPDNVYEAAKLYNQGDSLFQSMMKPHRGKVVYVDFWAPWCAPCMSEIRNSGKLKRALEGKDVVYYYICVGCKKDSWNRTVKKYDISGEHYLTNEKEYSLLSERYKIAGIPRFMMIDPAGRVVNDDAPRPSDVGGVVEAVTLLLNN